MGLTSGRKDEKPINKQTKTKKKKLGSAGQGSWLVSNWLDGYVSGLANEFFNPQAWFHAP
jgi:hypothetical protein